MNSPYALFLDDVRDPKDGYLYGQKQQLCHFSQIPAGSWDVVRNFDQFVFKIKKYGIPYAVSFDNDLSEGHFKMFCDAAATGIFDWEFVQPKMGLHCLQFLLNECEKQKVNLPRIFIHTANPYARKIMEEMLGRDTPEKKSAGGIILG